MAKQASTHDYLSDLGVRDIPPRTSPFDPGYDASTFLAHLEQSAHLMASMKISMACWQVADESVTRRKIAACREYGVPTSAGGGPMEVAAYFDKLPQYLDLCENIGFSRIEAGEGIVQTNLDPDNVVTMASDRGLEVQFELGEKHSGAFDDQTVDGLLTQGNQWLNAGAKLLVIEARENAQGVGLFDSKGTLDEKLADRFMKEFGEEKVVFEAPIKKSQFALMDHFGPGVQLGNVRLEEILRLEIYRRGLHSDAFARPNLRPNPAEER